MKIGISIVHFGEQKLLDDCLKSLKDGMSSDYQVKIFNCNENNIGFTSGNNRLISQFIKQNINTDDISSKPFYDWIWLLNNDTTVPKETLIAIQEELELKINGVDFSYIHDIEDVGIIGFKILSMDNPDLIHHAGTVQAFPNGVHKSGSVKLRQFTKCTEEKWVTFASVLIRREVFETCGFLDERFFNYCSDSDFCYTARSRGWKVIYKPTFVVHHKVGQSGNPNPEQQKIMVQDTIQFQNKWMSGKLFYDLDHELLN